MDIVEMNTFFLQKKFSESARKPVPRGTSKVNLHLRINKYKAAGSIKGGARPQC
jgi:hypothetical protein